MLGERRKVGGRASVIRTHLSSGEANERSCEHANAPESIHFFTHFHLRFDCRSSTFDLIRASAA